MADNTRYQDFDYPFGKGFTCLGSSFSTEDRKDQLSFLPWYSHLEHVAVDRTCYRS